MLLKSDFYWLLLACLSWSIQVEGSPWNVDSYQNLPYNLKSQIERDWNGRWFPEKMEKPKTTYEIFMEKHMRDMNTVDEVCDDGKTNITLDGPESFSDFMCMRKYIRAPKVATSLLRIFSPPDAFVAQHVCMNETIEYEDSPPLYGNHRKIWARWGEYKYLPPQRWVHNLEHGGVVMVYHPCADPYLVGVMKKIVRSCIFRHIITPYRDLPLDTPFALLVWGRGYFVPNIDAHDLYHFIRAHALHGPENISQDGKYDHKLTKPAQIVSTINDDILCPDVPPIEL